MKKLIFAIILVFVSLSYAEYFGSQPIDKVLSFDANTHDAATSEATDADSVPVYRVYEDNDDTIMSGMTGNMALRDSSNTNGQYRATITLSTGNGFEVGKSYTIRITATVDNITGGMSHNFQVIAAPALASALATHDAKIGTPANIDGGGATIADNLKKFADDNGGADYDAELNSLLKIREQGDDAWKTGTAAQTANTVDVAGGSTPAGGETGTEANTYLDDGVKWVIDDEGAGIDARLVFTLGTDKTANFIIVNGYIDSHGARPVDIYAFNYLTTSFDKLSDTGSQMQNASADADYGPYLLLPAHQQAADGEVIVQFANASTTSGDDLYLDQVLILAVGTGGFTLDDIGDAVAQHDVSNHTDHNSFGFRAAVGGMFEEFTITTSDTASSFTCSSLPAVTNNYQYHRVRLHDVSTDEEYGSWILSMNASGVIILGKAFVITPEVGDEIYIQGSIISPSEVWAASARILTANTNFNDPTAAAIVDEWESQSIIDPDGFRVNVYEIKGTNQTANDNGADLNTLISNQGNWTTATGFATDTNQDSMQGDIDSISSELSDVSSELSNIATDTSELQTNQGDWATATGFEEAEWQQLLELMFTYDATATYGTSDAGSVVAQISDNAGGASLTVGAIADGVWTELIGDHSGVSGSTAEALAAAQSAGDPWSTTIPGSYGAGTAGNIVGNYLDESISGLNNFDPDNDPVELLATGGTAGINAEELTDSVWDELLTGATHNIATSAGRRLRDVSSAVILTGTSPDTSGTTNTSIRIELNGEASTDDGAYDPAVISIIAGTGAGQTRQIWEYIGASQLAYVNRDWKMIPDDTSEYVITSEPGLMHVNEGLAQGGSSNTIILNTLASSEDNAYHDQVVFIGAGVGQDQIGIIIAYEGTTKTATVEHDWPLDAPTTESMYAILPLGVHTLAEIGGYIWDTESPRILTANTNFNDPTAAAIVDEWESQSQSDPTGFHTNVYEIKGTDQTANDNGADLNTLISNQGNWATATGFEEAEWQQLLELMFTYDATATYGTESGSVVDQISDNASGSGTTPAEVWGYDISGIVAADLAGTQLNAAATGGGGGGDATAANQVTIIANIADGQGIGFVEATHSQVSTLERGNIAWLTGAGSTPSDMYTDTTTTPWEEVYHVIGDTETEYYREALYTAQGTPIVSAAMKVGQRVRQ